MGLLQLAFLTILISTFSVFAQISDTLPKTDTLGEFDPDVSAYDSVDITSEGIILDLAEEDMDTSEPDDSLAYLTKRAEFSAQHGEDEIAKIYLEGAEALAKQGFFTDALEFLIESSQDGFSKETPIEIDFDILDSLDVGDREVDSAALSKEKKNYCWVIYAAGSYYNNLFYFKQDTATDTSEFIQTSDDLIDLRVSYEWEPRLQWIRKFVPNIYFSNNKGKIGSEIDLTFLKNRLNFNGFIEGEYNFNEDYDDSSNVLRGELEGMALSGASDSRLNVSIRGVADVERFLYNRLYYTSNIKGYLEPMVTLKSKKANKKLSVGWMFGYDDYEGLDNIEDDRLRHGPQLKAGIWSDIGTLDIDGSFELEFYPVYYKKPSPYKPVNRDLGRAMLWSDVKPVHWFKMGLNGNYQYEREFYSNYEINLDSTVSDTINDTTVITLQIPWFDSIASTFYINYLELKPEFTFKGYSGVGAGISFLFEMQSLDVKADKHLDSIMTIHPYKVYKAFVPGVVFLFDTKKVFGEVGCDLRMEIVEINDNDSWEIRPYTFINYIPFSWLTIDVNMDYQYRKYVRLDTDKSNTNLDYQDTEDTGFSVSVSVGARF